MASSPSPRGFPTPSCGGGSSTSRTAQGSAPRCPGAARSPSRGPRVYGRSIWDSTVCEGGSKQEFPWGEVQPRPVSEWDPVNIIVPVETSGGVRSFGPDRWLTSELQDLGGFGMGLALIQRSDDLVYACIAQDEFEGNSSCGALRQTSTYGGIVPGASLDLALRPGGPQERVVFLSGQGGFGSWRAGAPSSAVLVPALGGAPFYVASLDGDPAPRLFERTDGSALALLEPRYLYDLLGLKFLRLTEPEDGPAPLTARPATLAG